MIANLADAVGRLVDSQQLPYVPALAVFTDAGGCNDPCVERLLAAENEQFLRIVISAPSLEAIGQESIDLREVCLSRARTFVFFKPITEATAQLYLKFLIQDGGLGKELWLSKCWPSMQLSTLRLQMGATCTGVMREQHTRKLIGDRQCYRGQSAIFTNP